MKSRWVKTLFVMHIMLMLYSMAGICSKLAANEIFFSVKFLLLYGTVILILGAYALAWQQIIKRIPLTTAFANKAITVVWGLIWGICFFHERITFFKLVGSFMVIVGVILFSKADGDENKEDERV